MPAARGLFGPMAGFPVRRPTATRTRRASGDARWVSSSSVLVPARSPKTNLRFIHGGGKFTVAPLTACLREQAAIPASADLPKVYSHDGHNRYRSKRLPACPRPGRDLLAKHFPGALHGSLHRHDARFFPLADRAQCREPRVDRKSVV